jgi:thiaminase/transcriptional activator TenA
VGGFEGLRQRHHALWERVVTHPFVLALGADTLPLEKFQRYLLQDHIFLRDLVRLVALAVAKAPDLDSARRLTTFLHGVLEGEESLFRDTFRSWGVAPQGDHGTTPAPVTRAFGDHLVRLAYEGGFPSAVAALAVTEGTYLDWATRLVRAGAVPRTPIYRAWVDIHSNPEFAGFVAWLHARLDDIPLVLAERQGLDDVVRTCLRYEAEFWDYAYLGDEG